ncbi:MAG: vanadium-dependent haloperoxidase [Archangium sp.]|nr:vanadium-dependent haloperoxidase [Archangium sp.]
MIRRTLLVALAASTLTAAQTRPAPADFKPSFAYQLLELSLEATARDIERIGARPTINSRELYLATAALYDAWAAYDAVALPSHGPVDRRPAAERTDHNRHKAMLAALRVVLEDLYPAQQDWLEGQFKDRGFTAGALAKKGSPEAVGNAAGLRIAAEHHHDGANQLGDERGGAAQPYADYTFYAPVNGPDRVLDVDHWQPIPFTLDSGLVVRPGFLTPHWYRVKPFALTRADQLRPPPPPKANTAQTKQELDQVIALNGSLTPEQKAMVEFMRDGPRSTGQSGHWLRFAQAVSRRDRHGVEKDVKLYFAVAAACFDAFIAAWDTKRAYDGPRPWTLVRVLYAGKKVRGWLGPGKGVGDVPAEKWAPYSPASFVTPPFPGYVSGHSTVSGAASKTLADFTGSDVFEDEDARRAGTLTELGASHAVMQSVDGQKAAADEKACDVVLRLPTFSATAEMAGFSRVLGGYHLQVDNVEGLALGRKVSDVTWARASALFSGKAKRP